MARRAKIQTPKPMTLGEFIISKVREFESQNNVTLGTMPEGIWQETYPGECWDTLRIGDVFENPQFITVDSLVKEYNFYVDQFESRMMKIGVW